MDTTSKACQKHKESSNEQPAELSPRTSTSPPFDDSDLPPPIYYDSEPSSQPPKYLNPSQPSHSPPTPLSSSPPSGLKPKSPSHQHNPASTISAILASPYDDIDAQRRADRKNKTYLERWRGFTKRNFGGYADDEQSGDRRTYSAPEWNVWGYRLAGGTTTPYRKKQQPQKQR